MDRSGGIIGIDPQPEKRCGEVVPAVEPVVEVHQPGGGASGQKRSFQHGHVGAAFAEIGGEGNQGRGHDEGIQGLRGTRNSVIPLNWTLWRTQAMSTTTRGLEDVVASPSSICFIDGNKGILAYRGYDIHDLAERSTFEETAYLLWFGKLPTSAELSALKRDLTAALTLPAPVQKLLENFKATAPQAAPMDTLRTAVSALGLYDADAADMSREANVRKAIRLLGQTAALVANLDRVRKGKPVVAPATGVSLAGNFLYMLNGERPSPTAERAFDIA